MPLHRVSTAERHCHARPQPPCGAAPRRRAAGREGLPDRSSLPGSAAFTRRAREIPVYWDPMGRLSVDVVILFGALLSIGVWGGAFFRAVAREMMARLWR